MAQEAHFIATHGASAKQVPEGCAIIERENGIVSVFVSARHFEAPRADHGAPATARRRRQRDQQQESARASDRKIESPAGENRI